MPDVLHVDDLYDLIVRQLSEYSGSLFNVGGDMASSISLRELTSMSEQLSGTIELRHVPEPRHADLPFYVSNCQAVTRITGWTPKRLLDQFLEDIWRWLVDERVQLEPFLSQ